MAEGLRDQIVNVVGHDAAERIFQILDEEGSHKCSDRDCIRLLPHSRLNRHAWRHRASDPRAFGLLGWYCFICGKPSWHRIHRIRTAAHA